MNSKIPKIISRIVATIFAVLVLALIMPRFWFWVLFEIVALLLVAIGCGGEWYLHHHPAGLKRRQKDLHHKLESRFIGAVAVGVAMEVFSLGHSIREGIILEDKVSKAEVRVGEAIKEAADAKFETSLVVSNNLVLKSKLAELELHVEDMDPLKRKVSSARAFVRFRAKDNATSTNMLAQENRAFMHFLTRGNDDWKDGTLNFSADKIRQDRYGVWVIDLSCDRRSANSFIPDPMKDVTVETLLKKPFGFKLQVNFLSELEILGEGVIVLVLNDKSWEFPIPKQNRPGFTIYLTELPDGSSVPGPNWLYDSDGIARPDKQGSFEWFFPPHPEIK